MSLQYPQHRLTTLIENLNRCAIFDCFFNGVCVDIGPKRVCGLLGLDERGARKCDSGALGNAVLIAAPSAPY